MKDFIKLYSVNVENKSIIFADTNSSRAIKNVYGHTDLV